MTSTVFVEIVDPWFKEALASGHRILTSLEGENPGGSIKDHMVKNELQSLLQAGRLRPGQAVSELSAGSTALSLAHYCRELSLRCILFLPDTVSPELVARLQKQADEVHLLEPTTAYEEYGKICAVKGYHPLNQLFDEKKKTHYHALGRQILNYAPKVTHLVGAVGTGHSLLGIAQGANIRAISAEPVPPWKISGCRNIDAERYGAEDRCTPDLFARRVRLESSSNSIFPSLYVQSHLGRLEISSSFQLVLGAIKQILNGLTSTTVFAVGAANRRSVK
jgi:cysteine synthase